MLLICLLLLATIVFLVSIRWPKQLDQDRESHPHADDGSSRAVRGRGRPRSAA